MCSVTNLFFTFCISVRRHRVIDMSYPLFATRQYSFFKCVCVQLCMKKHVKPSSDMNVKTELVTFFRFDFILLWMTT